MRTVPVRLPAGSLCRTTNLLVTDTFGVTVAIAPAATQTGRTSRGSDRWTMFTLTGTDGGTSDWFCLPDTAADLVGGAAVEDVLLARDEMANLAWAVERVVEGPAGDPVSRGRELRTPPILTAAGEDWSRLRWQLGTTVPPFWYPLVPRPNQPWLFEVQLMGTAAATDRPQGTLLRLGALIDAAAMPREGARLRRKFVTARGVDGSTAVWCRRRTSAGRGEGSSGLSFDRASRPHPSDGAAGWNGYPPQGIWRSTRCAGMPYGCQADAYGKRGVISLACAAVTHARHPALRRITIVAVRADLSPRPDGLSLL